MSSDTADKWLEDIVIDGELYAVWEYYDNESGETEWYDVYHDDRVYNVSWCINEGEPFYNRPTKESIREYLAQKGN